MAECSRFGTATFHGSAVGKSTSPIVGGAADATAAGYWVVAANGSVFNFGAAQLYGTENGKALDGRIVGMAATPTGRGYWLVGSDGGVFAFGAAQFYGSEGGKALLGPIVGIAATSTGKGYWLVGSDGGVFAFGTAGFHGSESGKHLERTRHGHRPHGDRGRLLAGGHRRRSVRLRDGPVLRLRGR